MKEREESRMIVAAVQSIVHGNIGFGQLWPADWCGPVFVNKVILEHSLAH